MLALSPSRPDLRPRRASARVPAGTLMSEPTESEPKSEIDRFRKATIGIRHEIAAVESDRVAIEQSPLRHAAHIGHDRVDAEWNHP